ncbi:nSTAND1 domain-containing NTPase [Herbidospora cretacea]|uniref:nSTAND1 domain-containing NTPase n=1 Tax=Herbidospora cretacea TaxID=28444 RepID=UPI0007733225|nr:hypothetical protein [Herbidospora cretacea]
MADPERITSRRDFAVELTLLREGAGLTVRQVAAKIGVRGAHSTLGDWFAGRGLPSTTSRELFLQVLRVCGDDRSEAWLAAWLRARRGPGPRPAGPEPYRGLAAFRREDAGWFFGRDDLTARLTGWVRDRDRGLLVVVGPSGSGKSSLLRAGLLAAVPEGVVRTPLDHPERAPLVVIDQFEEVFTGLGEADRRRAVTEAAALAAGTVVVLGLRADFYAQALAHPELVAAEHLPVGPIDEPGLRAAITEPARKAGLDLEAGLPDLILRDLRPGAGVLPLLSHALYATWRHSRGHRLTIADYHAVGGIAGAVALSADTAYGDLTEPQRLLARRLLLHLVHVSQNVADTRRRVARDDLPADAGEVLDRFIGQRLLTADDGTVEISHEALLTAWPLLRSWIDEDRAGLLAARRLADDARAWDAEGRDPAALYRGTRLAAAREWSGADGPGSLAAEFLEAAITLERRGGRRARRLLGALVTLLLVACGSGIAAVNAAATAGEQRDIAVSREVAGEVAATRMADPALAAHLARAAYGLAPTVEARGALLGAFGEPFNVRLTGHTDYVNDVAYAPGGQVLASAANDGTVRLWDVRGPHRPRALVTLPVTGTWLFVLSFSPDGRTLAATGADGVLRRWDVATARPLPALSPPGRGVTSALFAGGFLAVADRDGDIALRDPVDGRVHATMRGHRGGVSRMAVHDRILASAGDDGTARVWDLATARPLATLAGHTGGLTSVAFSPDGGRLVTAGADGTARVWDLADPARPRPLTTLTGHSGPVHRAVFTPEGDAVVTGGGDTTIRFWDGDGRQIAIYNSRPGAPIDTGTISGIAFSPDGRTLASSSYDHLLRLWDVPGPALPGGVRPNWAAPGVVITGNGREVRRWDVTDPHHPVGRRFATTSGVAEVSDDGSLLATGGPGTGMRLWLLGGLVPRLLSIVPGAATPPDSAKFSADRKVLVVNPTRDRVLRVWDIGDPARPSPAASVAGHTATVNAIAFAPAGRVLASFGYDRTVRLWDLRDPRNPVLLSVLRGHDNAVYNGAFSPDGTVLATTSQDATVRLWDVADPRRPAPLAVLRGHGSFVDSVAFSGDGRLLATGGGDPTINLWEVADPRLPRRWASLTGGPVTGLIFTGRHLVSGSATRPARIWDTDPARVGEAVCARAFPALGEEELAEYFPGVDPGPGC